MDVEQRSILAIAPGTRYLGFAIFDGQELVRFGVRSLTGRKTKESLRSQALDFLNSLLKRHHPTTLAIEDVFYRQARSCAALRCLTLTIRNWGKERKLKIIRYLPTVVKAHFCTGKKTRQALAVAMVRCHWFLYTYVKPEKKKTQHYWCQMFDAVALGALAYAEHVRTAETTSSPLT